MKSILQFYLIITTIFFLTGCITSDNVINQTQSIEVIDIEKETNLSVTAYIGKTFDYPTLVIWTEDMHGNYLKTIYLTKSFASGVYNYAMVGDTSWLSNSGPSLQPAALPYWTHKKGLINGKSLIPTPDNPYVDAYSGPTPKGNFKINTNNTGKKPYRLLVEVNQFGDYNKYWTNHKYSQSNAYKHSAQPSIIYAVTVDEKDSVFYLNPIGYGDPEGTSGKLFTNLSTLTSPLEIVEQVKVTIE